MLDISLLKNRSDVWFLWLPIVFTLALQTIFEIFVDENHDLELELLSIKKLGEKN